MKSYKIAFLNSKGGVGKSTLCILSALGLTQTRFKGKIKLIDTDSQKSSVSLLNDVTTKIELDFIPFNHASPNLGVSLLDQIEVAATRVETARRKYKRRQKDHESKKQRGQKVDAENHEKKIREELEELHEALAQKDELVGRARESLQGDADDWDFGFIMDLKTRFDDAQIDNLAARREGAYGRSDLEDFIARNLQP